MTNKEKARETALSIRFNVKGKEWIFTAIEEYCKSMAEWKDKQFKEYLEKKRGNIYWDETSLIDRNTKLDLLDEIINELFGEEVKVNNSDNDE